MGLYLNIEDFMKEKIEQLEKLYNELTDLTPDKMEALVSFIEYQSKAWLLIVHNTANAKFDNSIFTVIFNTNGLPSFPSH